MSTESDHFARLIEEGGCYRLPERAVIRVTGVDRLRYLNGQVSNDLRRLREDEAMPALVLTAKGKLCAVADFRVDGESILVETAASLGEELLARLERYAISDDVTFTPVTETETGWHVFGKKAETREGLSIARLGVPGRDVESRPEGMAEASADEIEVLRISRGVPLWGQELDENTLPQEAGLDRMTVDFMKGCYVGQEVVSRLKSVGRVNRHLCGFRGETSGKGGLFNEAGIQAGVLTSVAHLPENNLSVALGYLSSREQGAYFSVKDESGACLGRVERCEFPLVVS